MKNLSDFIKNISLEEWEKVEFSARFVTSLEYFVAGECYFIYGYRQEDVSMLTLIMIMLNLGLMMYSVTKLANCNPETTESERHDIVSTTTFVLSTLGILFSPGLSRCSGKMLIILGAICMACGIVYQTVFVPYLHQKWWPQYLREHELMVDRDTDANRKTSGRRNKSDHKRRRRRR